MAEKREIEQWITVNGRHIPIFKGDPESSKLRQIARNQEEADRLNKQKKQASNDQYRLRRYNNPKLKSLDETGVANKDLNDQVVKDAIDYINYGPESDSNNQLIRRAIVAMRKENPNVKFTQGDVNYIVNRLSANLSKTDGFKHSPHDFNEFILKERNGMEKLFGLK